MQKRKAFTLVELLVVIGIIAVLIAILLPALSRVRQMAALTKCAAQLRDTALAVRMYANDNKDSLPPFRYNDGKPNHTPYNAWNSTSAGSIVVAGSGSGAATLYTFFNESSSAATFMTTTNDEGNGLGRLLKTGYIKIADGTTAQRRLSCPSSNFDDPMAIDHTLYVLNPHVCVRTVAGGYVGDQWFKKLTKMAKWKGGTLAANSWWDCGSDGPGSSSVSLPSYRKLLMCDPMYSFATSAHVNGTRRVWNLCYPDGSVTTVTSSITNMRGSSTDPTATIGNWQKYTDQVNFFSDLVDGGGLYNSTGKFPRWNGPYNAIPIDPR